MTKAAGNVLTLPSTLDYSLTGVNSTAAVEKGLAEAEWYQCPVPRETMRSLLQRRDGPAIRDTILWFALILGAGYMTYVLWGTWWAVLPYALYSVLYASTSDSRWHETGHGTAFKTDWMNNALYEIASFMVMRESTVWRWSHTRHHSDTIIVGRDPEIAVPRPPDLKGIVMSFFNLRVYAKYFGRILLHSTGRMAAEEKTYIPETEFPKVYRKARIYVALYAVVIALSIKSGSILPLLLVGLTNLFGSWLAGHLRVHAARGPGRECSRPPSQLPDGVHEQDPPLPVLEHELPRGAPYVPAGALPCPAEVACRRQGRLCRALSEPLLGLARNCSDHPQAGQGSRDITSSECCLRRDSGAKKAPIPRKTSKMGKGWVEACHAADLGRADVIRFDHGKKTYALYRTDDGELYATDGLCTHGNVHLSRGLVKGNLIECSKHNGRFNLIDGSPARVPVCRGLATYPIEERNGRIFINVSRAGGVGARPQQTYRFRVVSNCNVATFIKELVLEPLDAREKISFTPGDYLQLDIPAYDAIRFREFDIPEPFAGVWERQHVFDLVARNPQAGRRNNYSLASNQQTESALRFNVRIATPPPGQDCAPGAGSSYVFSLKPGDIVSAIGPFGDFHIKPTQTGDGLHWRRRRHGSAPRPSFPFARDREHRAQGQLLVWGTVEAGDLLPGLLPRSSRRSW